MFYLECSDDESVNFTDNVSGLVIKTNVKLSKE